MTTIITDEKGRIINPIVPESVQHNAKVISQIRSLTASLFGIAAGIIGLESIQGFIFYLFGTVFVSELVSNLLAGGKSKRYFDSTWSDLYAKDVVGGLMSFVLTWTLFYGLVRS